MTMSLMVPTRPRVIESDYRRQERQGSRADVLSTLAALAWASPGVLAGFRLTWEWPSEAASAWVAVLCGGVTVIVLGRGWSRLRAALRTVSPARDRTSHQPTPAARDSRPALIRQEVDGHTAVLTPPARTSSLVEWSTGLVVFSTALEPLATHLGGRYALVLAGAAGLLARALASPVAWLMGPRMAILADRLEIRRFLGGYVVRWQDVFAAGERRGETVVYTRQPGAVERRGLVRRSKAYGIHVPEPGLPADVLVDAIEYYRTDDTARSDLAQPLRLRVIDDGAG
jgi:hypothetical protein